MATAPARRSPDPEPVAEAPAPAPPESWYDRYSITVDAMVTILDQSPEDFERLAPENRFCDYIDGVVYMPSPVSDDHQLQVGFFYFLVAGYNDERAIGTVLLGPAVLRLSERRKPEPDLFVRPADPAAGVAALLVLERLSPSTRGHDLNLKLTIYRDAGIPEILILDDDSHSLIIERKVGDGYHRERLTEGHFRSEALPGFWIDVAWLWSDPLPRWRPCLEAILAGPPA